MFFDDEYNYYIKCMNKIEDVTTNKKCKCIDITDLKINQFVYITFTPDSQKYMYFLYPKLGYIKTINNNGDIEILTHDNIIESLFHDSISNPYSNDLGYSYSIYIIE
jgi:hypothetical protein